MVDDDKKVTSFDDDDLKMSSLFEEKIEWHHQLLHRVSPTLVAPLRGTKC